MFSNAIYFYELLIKKRRNAIAQFTPWISMKKVTMFYELSGLPVIYMLYIQCLFQYFKYIKNSNIEFTIACILGVIKYNNVITEQI